MRSSKKALILLVFLLILHHANICAQDYYKYFKDTTLRIDYIFSGNARKQYIALDELHSSNHWYGKRQRLSEVPVEGNGQITARDHKTGKIIYKNSFSTLFQEWLSYPEAEKLTRSFENVFLMPMPRDTADITIDLYNNRRKITTSMTHTIAPSDILIRHDKTMPYIVLQQACDTSRCIHIAYVAEGYQKNEKSTFLADCDTAIEALFAHEPFKSSRDRFEIIAIIPPSKDSGTSIPSKDIWKDTPLHSNFDTFYSERYLTTLHLKDLHDLLNGTPYEHIIILVNTSEYGGGGILNSYNLSMTHHPMFKPVVVHEFGHSFAGLADEYAYEEEQIPMYPADVEPWEKNITTRVDFKGKWENLLKTDRKAGFYEGAGYSLKGVYRAYPRCRMRDNQYPEFCPACRQAIQNVIDFYTK